MTILNSVELVLSWISIALSCYSLLGFIRLARFWYQLPSLQRFQELFAYLATFIGSFIGVLILIVIMVVK